MDNLSPLQLDHLLSSRFKDQWHSWLPESVREILWRVLKVETTPIAEEIIHALQLLHVSDAFWTDFHIFNFCVSALNGEFADFHDMQIPEPGEVALAVAIAKKIKPDAEFLPEVTSFIRETFKYDGLKSYPYQLKGVMEDNDPLVDALYYNVLKQPSLALALGESEEEVQVFKLFLIQQYLHDRMELGI